MDQIAQAAENRIGNGQIRLRRAFIWLARYVLPHRLTDAHQGLARAERLNRDGYGLLLTMNHFSTRDALQALQVVFASQVLVRRPILAPVAAHQYARYGRLIRFLARRAGLQLHPIVTGDTVRALGNHHQRGQGLEEYLEASDDHLRAGGIVLLAPQGGRRASLGKPRGRPVGHLLAHARRRGVTTLAVMLLGLALPGVQDYRQPAVRGSNFGRLYAVEIGASLTLKEILADVGQLRQVDAWVFERLAELVPEAYSRPSQAGPSPQGAYVARGEVTP